MSKKGFKPYSHEATLSFIKEFHGDIFSQEDVANFDHFRVLRNDSVYRAVKVTPEDAQECIRFATGFVDLVRTFW